MQFLAIVAAFAAAAIAAPTAQYLPIVGGEQPASSGNACSLNQQSSCCNSPDGAPALGASCLLSALGGACSGSVQCCDVGGDGGLIALNLCVPIAL